MAFIGGQTVLTGGGSRRETAKIGLRPHLDGTEMREVAET
jgi:hypothetical protein